MTGGDDLACNMEKCDMPAIFATGMKYCLSHAYMDEDRERGDRR